MIPSYLNEYTIFVGDVPFDETDEGYEEYERLMNVYVYDELLLEAEFNKRGLGDDYNSILLERTTSMQSNETYKQIKEEMDMINFQIGFGGEVLYDNQEEIQLIDESRFTSETMGR